MKIDWIRVYQVSRFRPTALGRGGIVRCIFLIRVLSTRMRSISGAILMATQQMPTFSGTYDLNPGVHYLALTFPLGISMHILIRTSHLGRVSPRMVVSISHGRKMNSLTNAERYFRRTPFPICSLWVFPDIFVRTEPSARGTAIPLSRLNPNGRHNAYSHHLRYITADVAVCSSFTHFPPMGRYDHPSNAIYEVTANQATITRYI